MLVLNIECNNTTIKKVGVDKMEITRESFYRFVCVEKVGKLTVKNN